MPPTPVGAKEIPNTRWLYTLDKNCHAPDWSKNRQDNIDCVGVTLLYNPLASQNLTRKESGYVLIFFQDNMCEVLYMPFLMTGDGTNNCKDLSSVRGGGGG